MKEEQDDEGGTGMEWGSCIGSPAETQCRVSLTQSLTDTTSLCLVTVRRQSRSCCSQSSLSSTVAGMSVTNCCALDVTLMALSDPLCVRERFDFGTKY